MKAAIYEKQGNALDVLKTTEVDNINPDKGEIKIKIQFSAINPGDLKKRADTFGLGMAYPAVIPHSDGSGIVSEVGELVSKDWIGKKVCCFGAQSYRPFGTASTFCCVPESNVLEIPEGVRLEDAAQLGIPAITAYQSVLAGGDVNGKIVLVQGGAGAVGQCAIALSKAKGAKVLTTISNSNDKAKVLKAGADQVFLRNSEINSNGLQKFSGEVDHIIEVAFSANIESDVSLLKNGGSISTYATNPQPINLPFWPMIFANVRLFFLGSDDFLLTVKTTAMKEYLTLLKSGWKGLPIDKIFPLDQAANAHNFAELNPGSRVLVEVHDW